MASAVGRPIVIDKATQDKTRSSTARVKVILDLMDKLPKRMRLQYLDEQIGKIQERGLANIDQSIDDNTRVADANNNEIAIVEAIKNNGDRVVDTCVQDDTLSDLASNPKLPTAGVLSGKDPSLATIQDSG
ncbi:hypothetical protein KY289_007810 [Solanum tuberosum]|nr:hypothetical protein KY289_007810 [Solanum tuberosum]